MSKLKDNQIKANDDAAAPTDASRTIESAAEASQDSAAGAPAEKETGTSGSVPTGPVTLTGEQFKELQAKAAKADEHWDRLLRQAADFDNFKKRAARERLEAIKFANQALLEKLIAVLDHFEMAMAAVNNNRQADTLDSFKAGIDMIYSQFKSVLAESGLEEIDAQQKPFDPNLHEAVSQQESAEVPEGHVLQQLRKGYKLRERLIRPATVVVAKQPAAQ